NSGSVVYSSHLSPWQTDWQQSLRHSMAHSMRGQWPWLAILFVLGLGSRAGGEPARATLDQRLDALYRVRIFKEVALAPNDQWLPWVEEGPAKDAAAPPGSAIYVADLQAPAWAPRRISAGKGSQEEHDLAWSADSRLAFLSDHEQAGQLQLYVCDPA